MSDDPEKMSKKELIRIIDGLEKEQKEQDRISEELEKDFRKIQYDYIKDARIHKKMRDEVGGEQFDRFCRSSTGDGAKHSLRLIKFYNKSENGKKLLTYDEMNEIFQYRRGKK